MQLEHISKNIVLYIFIKIEPFYLEIPNRSTLRKYGKDIY